MDEEKLLRGIEQGNLVEVTEALANGADINYEDATLGTPLFVAIRFCIGSSSAHSQILDLILRTDGVDLNKPVFNHHLSPLMAAVVYNNVRAFDELVGNFDVEVNYQSKIGDSALFVAIKNNRVKMFEKLMQRSDVDLSLKDSQQRTCLMHAIMLEHEKMVSDLLARKESEPEFENYGAENALYLAKKCKNKKILSIVEDVVDPCLQTAVGKILKSNKLRKHCDRFFQLGIKNVSDAHVLNNENLSWKFNVDKQQERSLILKLLGSTGNQVEKPEPMPGKHLGEYSKEIYRESIGAPVPVIEAQNVTVVSSTPKIVSSLPSAPKNKPRVKAQAKEDEVPYAEIIPE